MAVEFIVTSDLPAVGARFARAAAAAPGIIETDLLTVGQAARDIAVPILADATPKRSGALAESTDGDVQPEAESVTVTLVKTEQRGDVYYCKPLDEGHIASPASIFYIEGVGFRRYKPETIENGVPGANYVEPALEQMQSPLEAMLAEQGLDMAVHITRVLE